MSLWAWVSTISSKKTRTEVYLFNSWTGLVTNAYYKGFTIDHIQSYARQTLISVGFMHSIGLTHTDLKVKAFECLCLKLFFFDLIMQPENILLVSGEKEMIKIPSKVHCLVNTIRNSTSVSACRYCEPRWSCEHAIKIRGEKLLHSYKRRDKDYRYGWCDMGPRASQLHHKYEAIPSSRSHSR